MHFRFSHYLPYFMNECEKHRIAGYVRQRVWKGEWREKVGVHNTMLSKYRTKIIR